MVNIMTNKIRVNERIGMQSVEVVMKPVAFKKCHSSDLSSNQSEKLISLEDHKIVENLNG